MPQKGRKGKLEEKLMLKREPAWDLLSKKDREACDRLAAEYMRFLDEAKTERDAVKAIARIAAAKGFVPIESNPSRKPGTRLIHIWKNKCVALAIIGKEPVSKGLSLVASHIDAPRLDLKQNPLHEEPETHLALLRTHYYGGIKKYQWATIPLALHGKIILKDGKEVEVSIGESPDDPVFTIEDVAPHLYRQSQAKRHLDEGFKGEELHAIIGSRPSDDKKAKHRTKLGVLHLLNQKYGLTEEDFSSSELELVPAGKARDVGVDRGIVMGYGQDDRSCAFASLSAICDVQVPKRMALALFFDKEEVGSEGNTGAASHLIQNVVGRLLAFTEGECRGSELRAALESTSALSGDTTSAVDPLFKDVHEPSNAAHAGYGVVLTKFTGSGGKFTANDASAEYVGKIRRMLNTNRIPWQSAELGKVDEGGGGTIAKFMAAYGMDVVDLGPSVLSLHAPMELCSKADLFCSEKAYRKFLEGI